MISKDYTKEIGLPNDKKVVPLRFALPVLIIIFGAALWFGVGRMAHGDEHIVKPAVTLPTK